MYSTIIELLLFHTILILIEMISPIWTCVTVCLMISFMVYILEGVRIELTLLCFKPWRIDLQVFFTILCFLLLVLVFVWFIVFNTPGTMYLASYSQVPPLSTVLKGISEFILILYIVTTNCLILKLHLMIDLALKPLCKFQISTYTTAKLDLDKALIIQGLDMRMTSLNKCVSLITSLTNSNVIRRLVFSKI